MTTVLHVQKVKGISGSENHLLSLLPGLRERGFDARMLVLHEREPEAADFMRELRARDVLVDELVLRLDVDPVAFGRLTRRLAALRPEIVHTHLVHGDAYGLPAAVLTRVPRRFSIDIDEPCELGGSNRFANPQEHLLAALNACMTVGYVAQCAVRGITLESLEIETDGEIDLRSNRPSSLSDRRLGNGRGRCRQAASALPAPTADRSGCRPTVCDRHVHRPR